MFGCNKVEDRHNHKDCVKKWSSAMNDAYTFASEHAIENSTKGRDIMIKVRDILR
jgi:hypothetical protein